MKVLVHPLSSSMLQKRIYVWLKLHISYYNEEYLRDILKQFKGNDNGLQKIYNI